MLSPQAETKSPPNWLTILAIWHVALGLILLFGAFSTVALGRLFVLDTSRADPLVRVIASLLVGGAGALSLVAAYTVTMGQRRGRAFSLFVNYVGFIIFLMITLQALEVFNGISSLADNIERSIVWVAAFVVLVVLYFQIGRLPDAIQGQVRRVGTILLGIAGLVLLIQLGAPTGLVGALGRIGIALPWLLITAAFGFFAWLIFRPTAAHYFGESLATREAIMGLLFLSPNLFGFIIFFAGPLLISLFLSFTEYELFTPPEWRGFQNYSQILGIAAAVIPDGTTSISNYVPNTYQEVGRITFTGSTLVIAAADPTFWTALRNTVVWVVLIIPLSIVPALGLAVLLNSKIRGVGFFRPLFFLPVVAGVVGVSLIWLWLFNPEIGSFNSLISSIVETVNRLAGRQILTDPKIQWVIHQDSALFSIAVMAAWMSLGNNMIIFLAGLQNIPRPLYEAARVDGATAWIAFRAITLPMLAPTTFFVVTTTLISAFQVFTEPYVMGFNNGRGPANSTITGVVYLYNQAFVSNHMGYGSAVAWVLVLIIFVLTLFQFRASEKYTNVG
jgi:ABC-type sugar transport system permease subunit